MPPKWAEIPMTLKKNPSKNVSSFQAAINLKIFGQGWSVALTALKHSTFSDTVLKPCRWRDVFDVFRGFVFYKPGANAPQYAPLSRWLLGTMKVMGALWKFIMNSSCSWWMPGQLFGGHGRLQLGHVLFSEVTRKQKIMAWRCLFTPCFTTFHFMKLSNWLFQPT